MAEREMNRHQQSLVDTCFEEGHYMAGMAILDKLRSEQFKPSSAHIRQLIYIALFPPAPSDADKGKAKRGARETNQFGTPSKIPSASKQNKASLLPSPTDSEAAMALLNSFQLTNTPAALLRALPSYSLTDVEEASRPLPQPQQTSESYESDDSHISKLANVLKECHDCWSILKPGVVDRSDDVKRRSQNPRASLLNTRGSDDEFSVNEDAISPIGAQSWSILDWLVRVCERDESSMSGVKSGKYSFLLLAQIRPPRGGVGPRSDVQTPVDLIFSCYRQSEPWRVSIGRRLVALLINLMRSPHFSPSQFIPSTTSKLMTSTAETLTSFISDLPASDLGLAFKLAVCDKYLADSAPDVLGQKSAPKPQARRARPTPASPQKKTTLEAPATLSKQASSGSLTRYPFTLPSPSRILKFLECTHQDSVVPPPHFFYMGFQLIMTFGVLAMQDSDSDKRLDQAWINILKDEMLQQKIDRSFSWDTRDEMELTKLIGMRESIAVVMKSLTQQMCQYNH